MKVTNFSRLSKLIAKNTPGYVLGEHGTVVVGVGGSLGVVLCSEELARQIHGPGGSSTSIIVYYRGGSTKKYGAQKPQKRFFISRNEFFE